MDFNSIMGELEKKNYHPVYFLSGEETYFIDQIEEYISRNILTEAEKDFNQHILYGKDVDASTIITYARRFPMMANHQVVIVREAQNIKEIEWLETYVNNPLNSTILVICYKYKTLDKRKNFSKVIAKKGVLLEAKKIYENQVPVWINKYLSDRKYSIEPQAALLMAECLGVELSKIANELNKLIISLPPRARITVNHIEENIGISKDFNVSELQNALGERDILKANRIVNYFASNTTANPIQKTISFLYNYFQKVLLYHFLEDKNNVASALQVNPYFMKGYIATAQKYPVAKLVNIVSILREYDMKSKGYGSSSATTQGDLYKEMIYKILHL